MQTIVILTDEPEKIRRAWGAPRDWSLTSFETAAEALQWEREMRSSGAIALEGQGYHFGVRFLAAA